MEDNKSFVIMFIIAAFITAVARLKFIIDNPTTVVRYENGDNYKSFRN